MAGGHSDYKRGEMEITGHSKTYDGFMAVSIWGGCVIILVCLMAILTFAAGLPWLPSLIGTFVVGVIMGLVLKMKSSWYGLLIGLAIFGAITSLLISALAG